MTPSQPNLPIENQVKAKNAEDDTDKKGQPGGGEAGGGNVGVPGLPPAGPPPPGNAQHAVPGDHEPPNSRPNWVERWTLYVEVLGLIGLAWYCCVNQGELHIFEKERDIMATEIQAAATNIDMTRQALDATRKQVNDAESGQRAWLKVAVLATERITNSAYTFSLKVTWIIKNFGTTPAIDITFPMAMFVENSGVNGYVSGGRIPQPNTGGPSIMPQETVTNIATTIPLPIGPTFTLQQWVDFRDVFSNAWTVGLFGNYVYTNDIFIQTGSYTDQFHHVQDANQPAK
jgi:hypothetical protein